MSDYSVNIGLLENTAVVRIWVRHHLSDINEIGPQCFRPFSLQYIEKGLLTMLTLFSWKSFWRSMYHGTINCQLEKEREQKLAKIVLFCRARSVCWRWQNLRWRDIVLNLGNLGKKEDNATIYQVNEIKRKLSTLLQILSYVWIN